MCSRQGFLAVQFYTLKAFYLCGVATHVCALVLCLSSGACATDATNRRCWIKKGPRGASIPILRIQRLGKEPGLVSSRSWGLVVSRCVAPVRFFQSQEEPRWKNPGSKHRWFTKTGPSATSCSLFAGPLSKIRTASPKKLKSDKATK